MYRFSIKYRYENRFKPNVWWCILTCSNTQNNRKGGNHVTLISFFKRITRKKNLIFFTIVFDHAEKPLSNAFSAISRTLSYSEFPYFRNPYPWTFRVFSQWYRRNQNETECLAREWLFNQIWFNHLIEYKIGIKRNKIQKWKL